MFDFLATALSFFYGLWPSYGVAIVLLTLAVMLILTSLTLKGTRSMLQLQALQPELKRIQAQFKDDRQKMNEEVMKFYQEHGINPLGGCLPMFIQFPVFIVLYNVISGLTKRTGLLESVVRFGDGRIAGTFEPKYLDPSTKLYQDLHQSREMVSWGIDLAKTPLEAMRDGFATGLPYLLLVVGIVATSYITQRQVQGRNPNAQVNPQMQMMMKVFPFMFAIISLNFPAALAVYWFVSGLYRMGQQAIITRHIYEPHNARQAASGTVTTTATEKPAKAVEKSAKAVERPRAKAAPGPARSGFLGKLLAGPQTATGNGAGTNGAGKSKSGPPDGAKAGSAGGPKAGGGRVTPPGSRPAASRKKKRRK